MSNHLLCTLNLLNVKYKLYQIKLKGGDRQQVRKIEDEKHWGELVE